MGVRITRNGESTLYDSTSNEAFGPIFASEFEAEEFLQFAEKNGVDDVRRIPAEEFGNLYHAFVLEQEDSILAREKAKLRLVPNNEGNSTDL